MHTSTERSPDRSDWWRNTAALGAFVLIAAAATRLGAWQTGAVATGRYADPVACATCHPQIASTYKNTGMGRSFYRLRPDKVVEDFTPGKTFKNESSGDFFAMIARDGKYYQRRWAIGFDGKETDVDEKQVDFVIGSGNHARTYLHLTSRNSLQELPLGWYAENGGYWAMNPGYERPDYAGSVRPVYYECMFCHNGYPRTPEGKQKDPYETTYLQPLPEGIDCQRCHGPGQDHVDKARAGASPTVLRSAIVNPARLAPDREMEVCMQCHLETTVLKLPHSIRRFDRPPFSYIPGQPLGDFSLAFDRQPGMNQEFEVAQGAYRLRQSQCFLKSEGKLRCVTCHNPHDVPRGEPAKATYNTICRNCHTAQLARLSSSPAHAAEADCITCHMPKRRTDDAVHVVMTDHLIARNKPPTDLQAGKPEKRESAANAYQGRVLLYYPPQLAPVPDTSLYMGVAQVRDQSNLKEGLPQLRSAIEQHPPAHPGFYAELAQGYLAAGDTTQAIEYFAAAAQREPGSAFRLIALADARMEARQFEKAELDLRNAVKLAPDDPRAWGKLGWDLWQQDKASEARIALAKAVSLDPEIPDIHNNFGLMLWGTGDQAGAEKEFRAALQIQPGIAEWRLNLGRALANQGKTAEARFQMEQSIRFKPDYLDARLDYARLLADSNEIAAAEAQARSIIVANPKEPQAHELLGSLLGSAGQLDEAMMELQTAVRLQPDFWRAQFELGIVMAQKGDLAGAVQHLQLAAQGKDAQVSAAARQALQQIDPRQRR